MDKVIFKEKWMQILLGSVLILAGLTVVILGIVSPQSLTATLSIIIAVSLFVIGAIFLVNGLSKTANAAVIDVTYLVAAIAFASGVVFLVQNQLIASMLVYIVSVSVLTIGVALLLRGIILCVRKAETSACVLAIILGVVSIILGILALIFQAQLTQVIYISSGVLLLVTGIVIIVYAVKR